MEDLLANKAARRTYSFALLQGAFVLDALLVNFGSAGSNTGYAGALGRCLSMTFIAKVALGRGRSSGIKALAMIGALLSFTVRSKDGARSQRLTLAQYLFRRLNFGKAIFLPPVVPLSTIARVGMDNPVESQREFANAVKSDTFCVLRPGSPVEGRALTAVMFTGDHAVIKQMLQDTTAFPGRPPNGFEEAGNEGMLALKTGPVHSLHRQVVSKFFSDGHMRSYAESIQEHVGILVDKWKQASMTMQEVNAHYDLSMLALDIIMSVSIGNAADSMKKQRVLEKDNEEADEFNHNMQEVWLRTILPIRRIFPVSQRFTKNLEKSNTVIKEMIARTQADDTPADHARPSILSGMLSLKDDMGARVLSQKEIFDETRTIRGAGHETTSNTLCMCLVLLSQNPRVLEKLRNEVDSCFPEQICPSYEHVKSSLPYTTQTIYETLRMYPTVPVFPRQSACDTTLGGFDVPKGTTVLVAQVLLNYNADSFPDPECFRPERFDQLPRLKPSKPVGVPGDKTREYGFCPFGAAQRTCIGQRLAIQEAVMAIAAIVKNFDFRLAVPRGDIQIQADITLGPKHGLPLLLSTRSSS